MIEGERQAILALEDDGDGARILRRERAYVGVRVASQTKGRSAGRAAGGSEHDQRHAACDFTRASFES